MARPETGVGCWYDRNPAVLIGFRMLLRDLPCVPDPSGLVALQAPISYPTYKRYRELQDVLSGTFAHVAPVPFGFSQSGRTERTWGRLVTPSYFSTAAHDPICLS